VRKRVRFREQRVGSREQGIRDPKIQGSRHSRRKDKAKGTYSYQIPTQAPRAASRTAAPQTPCTHRPSRHGPTH